MSFGVLEVTYGSNRYLDSHLTKKQFSLKESTEIWDVHNSTNK